MTATTIEKAATGFLPRKHGFRFVNSFAIDKSDFGVGEGKVRFGLCGGMCLAALRKFNDGARISAARTVPKRGTPLFDELMKLQIETLAPALWVRFYRWQVRPDTSRLASYGVAYSTSQQWQRKVRPRLRQGRPAILGLIRARGPKGDLSENHQVLATGYRFDPRTKALDISVYDPNWPSRDVTLSMNLRNPSRGIRISQSTGDPLRGFFMLDKS